MSKITCGSTAWSIEVLLHGFILTTSPSLLINLAKISWEWSWIIRLSHSWTLNLSEPSPLNIGGSFGSECMTTLMLGRVVSTALVGKPLLCGCTAGCSWALMDSPSLSANCVMSDSSSGFCSTCKTQHDCHELKWTVECLMSPLSNLVSWVLRAD